MARITVEISDPMHQWMSAEAGNRGVSLGEFVANCLLEKRNKSMPNITESHLLGILQNVSAKRGWAVAAKKLWTVWGIRGSSAELQTALRGLTAKGFIEEAQNGGYVLTELGFEFQARIERA